MAKLGPKAYEQCAGFLWISGGDNPMGNTSVHPESYEAVEKLLQRLGYSLEDVAAGKLKGISRKVSDYRKLAGELTVGEITLRDIVSELEKPGRDPREEMPAADSAQRCVGDERSDARDGAQGHRAQRH